MGNLFGGIINFSSKSIQFFPFYESVELGGPLSSENWIVGTNRVEGVVAVLPHLLFPRLPASRDSRATQFSDL